MVARHAKSPCCGCKVRRFGGRRRQCSACKKTWSIRKKKRGRPRIRPRNAVIERTLLGRYTLRQLAKERGLLSAPTLRYRFRQALVRFVELPRQYRVPNEPLILLADGMRFQFAGKPWVLYLMAVRPSSGKTALFLDPCLIPGQEGAWRWERALQSIPAPVYSRVRALVVDNLNGMQKIAKRQRWILQLCHFHLIHKLQFHRRSQHRALKGGRVREEIYRLVRVALDAPEGPLLEEAVSELQRCSLGDCGTLRMQAVVRDFLACLEHYRAYRVHPDLDLPTTTNVMESMGGIIRDLLRRSHSANNPQSLIRWTTALTRLHPHLVCNGRHSTD